MTHTEFNGQTIRELREAAGFKTQRAIADALEIKKGAYVSYELGESTMPYDTACKFFEIVFPDDASKPDNPSKREEYKKLPGCPEPDISLEIQKIEQKLGIPENEKITFRSLVRAIRTKQKLAANEIPGFNETIVLFIEEGVTSASKSRADKLAKSLGFPNGVDEEFYKTGKKEIESIKKCEEHFGPSIYAMRFYIPGKKPNEGSISQKALAEGAEKAEKEIMAERQWKDGSFFSKQLTGHWESNGPIKYIPDHQQIISVIKFFENELGATVANDKNITEMHGAPFPSENWNEDTFYSIADAMRIAYGRCTRLHNSKQPSQETKVFFQRLSALMKLLNLTDDALSNLTESKVSTRSIQKYRSIGVASIDEDAKEALISALRLDEESFAKVGDAAINVITTRERAVEDKVWKTAIEEAGISQEAIAREVGIKKNAISTYKLKGPSPEYRERLAQATGFGFSGTIKTRMRSGEPLSEEEAYALGSIGRHLPLDQKLTSEVALYKAAGMNVDLEKFQLAEDYKHFFSALPYHALFSAPDQRGR